MQTHHYCPKREGSWGKGSGELEDTDLEQLEGESLP